MKRRVSAGLLALGTALAVAVVVPPGVAQAAPAPTPLALINGDTVTGGATSVEATAATSAGFAVTVVTGDQWTAMTQTDFAKYQVLIAGDPTCNTIAPSFSGNVATWAPVVMGTAVNTVPGNRVVVGTDPVFHRGSHSGADKLIQDGIAFAGFHPGQTGLYFDTTCGGQISQPGLAASILQQVSSGAGTWTEDDAPPCGGNVAKIASTPAFDSLHSSDIQGWSCSVHESFPTFADDWHPLAVATDTLTKPVCGTDADTGLTACGEPYVLIAGSPLTLTSPDLTVAPLTGSDPTGSTHTVTATVKLAGSPVVGQTVVFTVSGQNNGAIGTCAPVACTTDSAGQVSFTYTGTHGAGDDIITASFTDSTSGTKQQATAAEHWTAPVSTTNTYGVNGTATRSGGTPFPFGPGTLKATVGATGFTDGALTLPELTYSGYRLFGFLPTTVTAHVAPTAPVTGTVAGGTLTVTSSVNLVIDQITTVGLPLLTPGSTCQTVAPSTVTLTGNPAVLTGGGPLTGGTYTAAKFTGCGLFGFFIEPLLNANLSNIPAAITATLGVPTTP